MQIQLSFLRWAGGREIVEPSDKGAVGGDLQDDSFPLLQSPEDSFLAVYDRGRDGLDKPVLDGRHACRLGERNHSWRWNR